MALLVKLQPATYTLSTLFVSIGGFLNGYDTGIIGAVVTMPQWNSIMGDVSATVIGVTVAMIMIGGIFPSFFSGQLSDKYGRLAMVGLGGSVLAIGCVLQAASFGLGQFIAGRLIAGIGEGIYLGTLNVYVCEIAPSRRRGTLAVLPQLFSCIGVCAGYFSCYGTVRMASTMSWRLPFILAAVLSAIFAAGSFFLPPSPRWLMLKHRRDDAKRAVERLGIQQAEAEKDILQVSSDDIQRLDSSPWRGFVLIFSRRYRSRTILGLFILGMVQLSGIDGVLYYAPTLFRQAGLPEHTAGFLASGLSAVLIVAISIPAAIFFDHWDRRTSVIVGGVLLTGTMFLVGTLYAADAVHTTGSGRWVVIVSIFVFAMGYSATWALVGKLYASEIQPGHTRAAANAVAQGLSFFSNALVALITPILLDKSAYGAYFLFGGLTFGTLLVLALYMPETRGEALENIQEVFSRPLQMRGISTIKSILLRQTTGRASTTGTDDSMNGLNLGRS